MNNQREDRKRLEKFNFKYILMYFEIKLIWKRGYSDKYSTHLCVQIFSSFLRLTENRPLRPSAKEHRQRCQVSPPALFAILLSFHRQYRQDSYILHARKVSSI